MIHNKKLYQHTLVRLYSFLIACQPLHLDPSLPVESCYTITTHLRRQSKRAISFESEEHPSCPGDENCINEKLERVRLEFLDETFRNHRTDEQCDANGKSTCEDGQHD
ncbi:hypothetical protein [Candidatus Symbiopectobacterium sp. NZEC151]|uniref:hypothetical protein n=1 Tax=Candidatus Symbiopectobacterium sp. NZEC151 TaxID=2820470 RepID=UPI002227C9DB|nr:hypothetical protein [Candidatus Symbiopectobacterium sp. NZEC151]MCW2473294.1 hypothetical protein [Candidatus Symbiopectobacterium sp. NZEC151]